MRRALILAAFAALAALLVARRAALAAPGGAGLTDALLDVADDAARSLGVSLVSDRWSRDAAKPEHVALVKLMREAEDRYGIPRDLVVRLAWQESRFDIFAHNAASDASGIMQIVPRWHPGVDPWLPFAAIDYGARYLRDQFTRFGSWELALKAYNWGPGNVSKWLASGRLQPAEPDETRNYSAEILADLAAAGRAVA